MYILYPAKDMLGHIVSKTKTESTSMRLDVSGLESGLYGMSLADPQGQCITHKRGIRPWKYYMVFDMICSNLSYFFLYLQKIP